MPAAARTAAGRAPNLVRERPKRVGERLSTLRKHAADHPLEECRICQLERGRPEGEADQGRSHIRRRPERAGRDRQQPGDVGTPLNEHAQDTELRRSRLAVMRSATSRCSISVASAIGAATRARGDETESATRCCKADCRPHESAHRSRGRAASRSISSTSPATIDAFDGSLGVELSDEIAIDLDGDEARYLWRQPQRQYPRPRSDLQK